MIGVNDVGELTPQPPDRWEAAMSAFAATIAGRDLGRR